MTDKRKQSPSLARWILSHLINHAHPESVLGDIEELYHEQKSHFGLIRARIWYWSQIPAYIPSYFKNSFYWTMLLLNSYFVIIVRKLVKNKVQAIINISGLAIGLTVFFFTMIWIDFEINYDRFLEHAEELYLVILEDKPKEGDSHFYKTTPAPLAIELFNDYPEILSVTRCLPRIWSMGIENNKFSEKGLLVDSSFIDMFSLEFIHGNTKNVFSSINNIVISEETAKKHFGLNNPIGRTLRIEIWYDAVITGVFKRFPGNSHLDFDFIVPFQVLEASGWDLSDWEGNNYYTYIQMKKNSDFENLSNNISGIIQNHVPSSLSSLILQAVPDIHLYSLHGDGPIIYIWIFFSMGLAILIIACVNYMNLAIARSPIHEREVGVRQVFGANRKQLYIRFIGESFLFTTLAFFVAVLIIVLLKPVFNQIVGINITIVPSLKVILFLLLVVIFTGFMSGIYPSYYLSSLNPIEIIRGTIKTYKNKLFLRKFLVISQYAVSLVLIICTIFVYQQLNYLLDADLGYSKENLIYFELKGDIARHYNKVKQTLEANPQILGISRCSTPPIYSESAAVGYEVDWEGRKADYQIPSIKVMGVDAKYLESLGIKMNAGRFFSEKYSTDADEAFVINESAAKAMGLNDPIGKTFSLWNFKGIIIGVINDFNFRSLNHEIEPLVMKMNWALDNIVVQLSPKNQQDALKFIERTLSSIQPDYTFNYHFIHDKIIQNYSRELRMKKFALYVSGLAIFISSLGLFGLSSFTIERKRKELGIRKVLGASFIGITFLLAREFLKWIIIANIIGWPVAWYFINTWLQNYAYRIAINIHVFLLASLVVFFIAFLTLGIQLVKTGIESPIKSLRYE